MEKLSGSGKKITIRGDSGSSLSRMGKEHAHSGGVLLDGVLDAEGWSKPSKIARW